MSSDIYLLPTCNPYGFSKNIPFNKEDGTDLNKDFPDFQFENENTEKGRQPETQILMKHIKENVLSIVYIFYIFFHFHIIISHNKLHSSQIIFSFLILFF